MRATNSSSLTSNMVVIVQALRSYGIDIQDVLGLAGIDRSYFEHTRERVPAELLQNLIDLAYEKTEDPAFALRCVHYFNPANMHALGMSLLCSVSLRDFCERVERFFALLTTLEKVELSETRNLAGIRMLPTGEWSENHRHFDADIFTGNVLKFVRLIYEPSYCPARIQLTWTPPQSCLAQYHDYFGCDIEFSAPVVAIYFDKRDYDVALPASNAALARQNDQVVMDLLSRNKLDLPSQVYSKLIELLPSGNCSRELVASSLHMSVTTLHEKMKRAGTSYQKLLHQTRKELAEHYILQGDLSLTEVAYLLGFSDSGSFSRAFKGWEGISPREYRNKIAADNPGNPQK